MKICTECGAQLSDDTRSCTSCGASLADAQVVPGDTDCNGFDRVAAHHRDEPIQRIMEIETVEGTEIAYQHVRHQDHHVVHGDAYEVDVLFAIEQAHHGHKRISNIDADLGHAHERKHAHKADY